VSGNNERIVVKELSIPEKRKAAMNGLTTMRERWHFRATLSLEKEIVGIFISLAILCTGFAVAMPIVYSLNTTINSALFFLSCTTAVFGVLAAKISYKKYCDVVHDMYDAMVVSNENEEEKWEGPNDIRWISNR